MLNPFHGRRVAREEGILLGGSSGTCLTAAFRYVASCSPDELIVALCPDTARNYLSKMYNERWIGQNGFLISLQKRRLRVTCLHYLDVKKS